MKLDLIVPTYNRSVLLSKCLSSIEQAVVPATMTPSVLVVDNNSTDDTAQVISDFIKQSKLSIRSLFVAQPGKSAALNRALSQTDGELVCLIDDDEEIDPMWFAVVDREFLDNPELDFIGGPCYPNWETPAPTWLPEDFDGAICSIPNTKRERFCTWDNETNTGSAMLMGGNAVIRRAVLHQVLPYPEDLGKIGRKIRSGEDEVIYHRLLAINAFGIRVPDLIIYHWIPAARLTKKYYRKWTVGRGISVGYQYRERSFEEASLFGIPRYMFGNAIWSVLTARSHKQRFRSQLIVLDCFAALYGRHFYGRDLWRPAKK